MGIEIREPVILAVDVIDSDVDAVSIDGPRLPLGELLDVADVVLGHA